MCVKNAEKTIQDCLASIVNQDYPRKLAEIIVVDGRSKDKTVDIARKQISDSGMKSQFYSDNGAGLGAARQIVLENTSDRYIVWVDGDTMIRQDFVRKQVEFMERNPRVCVSTGAYIHGRNIHSSLPASLESIGKYVGSIADTSGKEDRGVPPNDASIYRVEALKQVGGFDTNIRGASEDEDIISRMRKKGWIVIVNAQAKYYAIPKATWQSVWTESVWFGYGGHFLSHKDRDMHVCMYRIPVVHFFIGFRVGSKAYRLTSEKKSFLLPLDNVFMITAWWYGYIRAHVEGYGH